MRSPWGRRCGVMMLILEVAVCLLGRASGRATEASWGSLGQGCAGGS